MSESADDFVAQRINGNLMDLNDRLRSEIDRARRDNEELGRRITDLEAENRKLEKHWHDANRLVEQAERDRNRAQAEFGKADRELRERRRRMTEIAALAGGEG